FDWHTSASPIRSRCCACYHAAIKTKTPKSSPCDTNSPCCSATSTECRGAVSVAQRRRISLTVTGITPPALSRGDGATVSAGVVAAPSEAGSPRWASRRSRRRGGRHDRQQPDGLAGRNPTTRERENRTDHSGRSPASTSGLDGDNDGCRGDGHDSPEGQF